MLKEVKYQMTLSEVKDYKQKRNIEHEVFDNRIFGVLGIDSETVLDLALPTLRTIPCNISLDYMVLIDEMTIDKFLSLPVGYEIYSNFTVGEFVTKEEKDLVSEYFLRIEKSVIEILQKMNCKADYENVHEVSKKLLRHYFFNIHDVDTGEYDTEDLLKSISYSGYTQLSLLLVF
jgi:hypothetical protein